MPQLPDVPTVAESGVPGFESTLAYGILAPRGTPAAVLEEIRAQLARITATKEFRERVDFEGAVVLRRNQRGLRCADQGAGGEVGKVIRAAAGLSPD